MARTGFRPSGGAALTAKQTTVDVGALPVDEHETTIADADATATSRVFAQVSLDTPPGKEPDDVPMDSYAANAAPAGTGQITVRITCLTGLLHDQYLIDYLVL